MIDRILGETVAQSFRPGFVTIIYGARRVGKTVLLAQIRKRLGDKKTVVFDGDTQESRSLLGTTSEIELRSLVVNADVVVVDEAQRIPSIGLVLKIIIDRWPEKKILVTGSSSLELASGIRESLTGRHVTFRLFPLSTAELSTGVDRYKIPFLLGDQLIFGGYPNLLDLVTPKEKEAYLESVVEDYLLRDTLLLERIDNPDKLRKLTTLLAFQLGNEVSHTELANELELDVRTVARYLYLLELSFVIFSLGSYAKNLRDEVTEKKKYYFYDLGVRNAVIRQFFPLETRPDKGALWENFLIVERMKKREYTMTKVPAYFWRNYQRAEVDYLETEDGKISAFEFKWGKGSNRTPKAFREGYGVSARIVNRENYLDFVL